MPLDDPNVGLAFGLTIAAGAATAVGAAVVFVPRLVKLASRRTLAGALALSAGVMTYVSFVEILGKSRLKFLEAGYADNVSYMYATVCFFGGVVLMTVRLELASSRRAPSTDPVDARVQQQSLARTRKYGPSRWAEHGRGLGWCTLRRILIV
jgi:zinc transporter ZupT